MLRRRTDPDSSLMVVGGILATLLFHLGMYFLLDDLRTSVSFADPMPEEESLELHFEPVELLRWGEVMPDPNALPVIANPELETVEETVVEIEPEVEVEVEPEDVVVPEEEPPEEVIVEREPEERPEDQRTSNEIHNPNRPVNNEEIQGSEHGVVGGTSLTASAIQHLFARTQSQLQRAFRAPSSLSEETLSTLEATVHIYVNAEGRITHHTFRSRSGNSTFDAAVEAALNVFRMGSRRLHLPTDVPEAMDLAVNHGLDVQFHAD